VIRGGAGGGDPPDALRGWAVDQGDRAPAQAAIATPCGRRCARASRRAIGGRRGRRSSIPSEGRSTGCFARSRGCQARGCASCSRSWTIGATRRSSTTTCARCGRCSRRGGPSSGRSTARASSASSTSEPSTEIPVGCGQTRRGYVVVGCLPYSRAGAGTRVFRKRRPSCCTGSAPARQARPSFLLELTRARCPSTPECLGPRPRKACQGVPGDSF
jgi:hypothetical protein